MASSSKEKILALLKDMGECSPRDFILNHCSSESRVYMHLQALERDGLIRRNKLPNGSYTVSLVRLESPAVTLERANEAWIRKGRDPMTVMQELNDLIAQIETLKMQKTALLRELGEM